MFLEQPGFCPICEKNVVFTSEFEWLRDHFNCSGCKSIPRERALMSVINTYFPNWRKAAIHECSPGGRGVSLKLGRDCKGYSCSQYYPDIEPGEHHKEQGFQCQNLQQMTFGDSSFDLFITQDVMEHVFDPDAAFLEIARVLKPGGMHIFTVPIVKRFLPTDRRASMDPDGEIIHLKEPQYHGNPVSNDGSLVTLDWGYDIVRMIAELTNMPTTVLMMDDLSQGIRAELLDVVVSKKL